MDMCCKNTKYVWNFGKKIEGLRLINPQNGTNHIYFMSVKFYESFLSMMKPATKPSPPKRRVDAP